jgi:DNA mismatch repair protein MutS
LENNQTDVSEKNKKTKTKMMHFVRLRSFATRAEIAATAKKKRLTPAMRQYTALKEEHAGYLLLFRIGDFYEAFYDDAVVASQRLGIALTSRKRRKGSQGDIPMAGIPHHALDNYLERLVKAGVRVAVCDQVESVEEARRRKSVVRREVVRLVTPGTLVEDRFLSPAKHNFLCALMRIDDANRNDVDDSEREIALAWLDLSTGDFQCSVRRRAVVEAELLRISPSEVLVDVDSVDASLGRFLSASRFHVTALPDESRRQFELDTHRLLAVDGADDDALSSLCDAERRCCAAVLAYVRETQKGSMPAHLMEPERHAEQLSMMIDPCAWHSLELTESMRSGDRANSLLGVIDRTVTAAGGRLLASRLAAPSLDVVEINERLDAVECFVRNAALGVRVREALSSGFDMVRSLQRLSMARGSPRDLGAIGATLDNSVATLRTLFGGGGGGALPRSLSSLVASLPDLSPLVDELARALVDDPPLSIADGGFVASGYSDALDALRGSGQKRRADIDALARRYRKATGASAGQLKIRANRLIGWHVEVDGRVAMAANDCLGSPCQSLASGNVRFRPIELVELESRLGRADREAIDLELAIFEELCERVLAQAHMVRQAAHALASIDVAAALADTAARHRYVRPTVDRSTVLDVTDGRHPIVEAMQRTGDSLQPSTFVPNSCALGVPPGDTDDGAEPSNFWLITGPNMAGKSTYLRQQAIVALLAQMGSFVPASSARVGIIDSMFSRVGAADDLAKGMSTFMVEMLETSNILANARRRALVIMDEVGRGTSTRDGLAIAWAVAEHLHTHNRCRALFATHYHELTDIDYLERLSCHAFRVQEHQDGIIFDYRITPGIANQSYGLNCAQIAGLPQSVIERAYEILHQQQLDK